MVVMWYGIIVVVVCICGVDGGVRNTDGVSVHVYVYG